MIAGQKLHFWIAMLSSKNRQMKPSQTIVSRANTLNIDYLWAKELGKKQARKLIRVARSDLWDVQTNATQERVEWLESNTRNITRAESGLDWN